MKKNLLLLLLVIIGLFCFTSCKEKQEQHVCNYEHTKTVNATCTNDGFKLYTCTCGKERKEILYALGHDMKNATCQSSEKCSRCDYKVGTKVSCTYRDGKCIYCGNYEVTSIYCPFTKYDVEVGENLEIIFEVKPSNATNKKVTIISSNPSILKVGSNNVLTGVSEGIVTVTIKTYNNISVKCEVTVLPQKHDVTFYVGNEKITKIVTKDYIDLTENEKIKYVYEWYTDESMTTLFDFSSLVTDDMILYGKELSNEKILKNYIKENGKLLLFSSSGINYYLILEGDALKISGSIQATMNDIGTSFVAVLRNGGIISATVTPSYYDKYHYNLISTTIIYSFDYIFFSDFSYSASYYNYTGDSAYVSNLKNLTSSILRTSFYEIKSFIKDLKR